MKYLRHLLVDSGQSTRHLLNPIPRFFRRSGTQCWVSFARSRFDITKGGSRTNYFAIQWLAFQVARLHDCVGAAIDLIYSQEVGVPLEILMDSIEEISEGIAGSLLCACLPTNQWFRVTDTKTRSHRRGPVFLCKEAPGKVFCNS